MKTITHISWLIALFALCQITTIHAQTSSEPITQQVTLHVATAGTLPDIIAPSRRPLITNLKLTGQLNGTDLRLIREMAGADVNGNPTQGYALESLDLSEVEIFPEGEAYFIEYDTVTNTRGDTTIHRRSFYTDRCLHSEKNSVSWSNGNLERNDDLLHLFENCYILKSVKLPLRRRLGPIFADCTSLTSVDIPEGVTELYNTFEDCTSLTNVNIPKGVTNLTSTFYGCTSLTHVNIPEGVTDMLGTFFGCTSLTHVNIPEGVTNLEYTFFGCTSLTHVNIPEGVTNLSGTFQGCTSLTNVNIPEGVTDLDGTFSGCTSLTHVDIPENVTNLRDAFSGCTSLTNVDIPENVTDLRRTFQDCTSLTNVNIPENVTNLSGTFQGCTSLTNVNIPENVTNLSGTFQGCTSLTSVNILGESPLPLNEYSYGFKDTFRDCPNLQAIRFFSPAPLIPSIYPGISNDVIVYIPKGSYMSYWLTTWGDYNLVEFDATDIDTPIRTDKAGAREHYSIDGKRLTAPQHGLNIIREADGTTKKILIQ